MLIVSTNLFELSDSRCLSGKLDSEALDGAVVALSLRTYKFLSSPPGVAFFGVLPMATTAISGVPISRARLNSTPFLFFLSYLILLDANATSQPALVPHLTYVKLNFLLLLSLLSHSLSLAYVHAHSPLSLISLPLPLDRPAASLASSAPNINSRPFLLSSRPSTRGPCRTSAGAGISCTRTGRTTPSFSSARTYYAGRHTTAVRPHDEAGLPGFGYIASFANRMSHIAPK